LQFLTADRPPDIVAPVLQWAIGDMLAGSADHILLTMRPAGVLPKGTTAQVRMWVTDDAGHSASAIESTLFTDASGPYVITIVGQPKNPSVGLDGVVTYTIEVRNVTANTQNARITSFLPDALTFIGASPPGTLAGGSVSWNFPTLRAGATATIELRTGLKPDTVAGTTLTNTVNVSDEAGNVAERSYIGHVRGRATNEPPLSTTMTVPRTTTPGGRLRYSLRVKNAGLAVARGLVLKQTIPAHARLESSTPQAGSAGNGVLQWRLADLLRGGQHTVSVTFRIDANVDVGALLTSNVEVTDSLGNSAFDSADTVVEAR
jgi:uncharacterized repeat protein (TIGR01451 family)